MDRKRQEALQETLSYWNEKHEDALRAAEYASNQMQILMRELGSTALDNVIVVKDWLATETPFPTSS